MAGAQFAAGGKLPPEINLPGFSAAGTTLAVLIVLGLAALWLGRAVVQRAVYAGAPEVESADITLESCHTHEI